MVSLHIALVCPVIAFASRSLSGKAPTPIRLRSSDDTDEIRRERIPETESTIGTLPGGVRLPAPKLAAPKDCKLITGIELHQARLRRLRAQKGRPAR